MCLDLKCFVRMGAEVFRSDGSYSVLDAYLLRLVVGYSAVEGSQDIEEMGLFGLGIHQPAAFLLAAASLKLPFAWTECLQDHQTVSDKIRCFQLVNKCWIAPRQMSREAF